MFISMQGAKKINFIACPLGLTCNAIPRLCRFHFVRGTFGPQELIRNLKHLSYSTFVILIL